MVVIKESCDKNMSVDMIYFMLLFQLINNGYYY